MKKWKYLQNRGGYIRCILVVLMVALVAMGSFSACSSKSETPDPDIVKQIKSGKYSFGFDLEYRDQADAPLDGSISGTLSVVDKKIALGASTDVNGEKIDMRIIFDGDKTTVIIDSMKIWYTAGKDDTTGLNEVAKLADLLGDLKRKSEGTEKYKDKEYKAIEYKSKGGAVIHILLNKDNQAYAISESETVMIVKDSSDSIPEGVFDIPSDYQEMDPTATE